MESSTIIILNHSNGCYGYIDCKIYETLKENQIIQLDNDLTIRLMTKQDFLDTKCFPSVRTQTRNCKVFVVENKVMSGENLKINDYKKVVINQSNNKIKNLNQQIETKDVKINNLNEPMETKDEELEKQNNSNEFQEQINYTLELSKKETDLNEMQEQIQINYTLELSKKETDLNEMHEQIQINNTLELSKKETDLNEIGKQIQINYISELSKKETDLNEIEKQIQINDTLELSKKVDFDTVNNEISSQNENKICVSHQNIQPKFHDDLLLEDVFFSSQLKLNKYQNLSDQIPIIANDIPFIQNINDRKKTKAKNKKKIKDTTKKLKQAGKIKIIIKGLAEIIQKKKKKNKQQK